MKIKLSSLSLSFLLLCLYSSAHAEQNKSNSLTAKDSVIHCARQAEKKMKEVDPNNPCSEGTDCFYAWQLEQHCGAILTKKFPNCFFSVSSVTQVQCLEKGMIVQRDKQNWNPNNKFYSSYTLIDYKELK